MRILGIDPGLAIVGFAILDVEGHNKRLIEAGVIRTSPDQTVAERLREIYDDFSEIIKEYKPDIASIEQIFFSKNVTTGINVSQARGVIILALEQAAITFKEFGPSQLKLALTGDGTADKKAIQKMVMLELGLSSPPKPDDAADAVNLALTLSSELR